MKISFLQPSNDRKAVKRFTEEGVQSYPAVRNFTSHSYEVSDDHDGLEEKTQYVQHHAETGACMLKGFLSEELDNESRAGKVDREAPTNNLILDIDGLLLPQYHIALPIEGQAQMQLYAEAIIQHLPEQFQTASYILHASSSMGMKGNRFCMHLDFMLSDYVSPLALKEYVVFLNHAIPLFEQNFQLSASGTALRYPLDRTVVDNSHLIYIGTPQFAAPLQDPIPCKEDRVFLVKKRNASVSLTDEITDNANSAKNSKRNERKINDLRALAGLPRRQEKTAAVNINGARIHVVTNPESCLMGFASDDGNYVRYNINGGDSGGYYVNKYNPSVVHNFKGEPNFLFEVADSETYQWHLDTYIGTQTEVAEDEDVQMAPLLPLVFRDEASNAYYNALLDTGTARISRIAKTDRAGLPDWMAQYENVMPENVPIWNYEFNPHREDVVNFRQRFINKYLPSQLWSTATADDGFVPLTYDTSQMLYQDCPTIAAVIYHVIGSDMVQYHHFINWLAAALQTRDKLSTAWILQGTQGTGKGVLFENIISPLVGTGIDQSQNYAVKVRIENIEDQFNSWQECALFIAFDEFRLSDTQKSARIFNKIKSMISEIHEPIRGMRENLRTVRSYSNYLFFSNDMDVMWLPEGDRRFNVAERQETKLREVLPDERFAIQELIPQELALFAKHMKHFEVDKAMSRIALESEAKKQMREVSRTTIHDFVHAAIHGDLEFFLPIMDMPYQAPNAGFVLPAQNILKAILRDYGKDVFKVTVEELRIIYCAFIGPSDNSNKFGKMMSREGLQSTRIKVKGQVKRGYTINWTLRDNDIEELRAMYIDDIDNSFGPATHDVVQFPGGAA